MLPKATRLLRVLGESTQLQSDRNLIDSLVAPAQHTTSNDSDIAAYVSEHTLRRQRTVLGQVQAFRTIVKLLDDPLASTEPVRVIHRRWDKQIGRRDTLTDKRAMQRDAARHHRVVGDGSSIWPFADALRACAEYDYEETLAPIPSNNDADQLTIGRLKQVHAYEQVARQRLFAAVKLTSMRRHPDIVQIRMAELMLLRHRRHGGGLTAIPKTELMASTNWEDVQLDGVQVILTSTKSGTVGTFPMPCVCSTAQAAVCVPHRLVEYLRWRGFTPATWCAEREDDRGRHDDDDEHQCRWLFTTTPKWAQRICAVGGPTLTRPGRTEDQLARACAPIQRQHASQQTLVKQFENMLRAQHVGGAKATGHDVRRALTSVLTTHFHVDDATIQVWGGWRDPVALRKFYTKMVRSRATDTDDTETLRPWVDAVRHALLGGVVENECASTNTTRRRASTRTRRQRVGQQLSTN